MHYLRSTSDSLGLRAILKVRNEHDFEIFDNLCFLLSNLLQIAKFFRRLPNYFFIESTSFSCEKTTMKVSGPVNELFS